jgi:hypothetical protein
MNAGSPVTSCKSCGAPIQWARTSTGKRMPIDVKPSHAGTINLAEAPDGEIVASVVGLTGPAPRYLSHFSTCKDAAQHRRAR